MEFNKAYNRQEFVRFLRNNFLPEDFVPSEEHIEFLTQTTYSTQAVKLGTCESLDLTVFEIRHTSKHDARVSLSKEAFRLLADELEDRALVAFVPEDSNATYRFSFIEITISDDENSSRITRSYSNPRRYSYLLGEGISYYTPNKYLNKKGRVVNYEDLLKRFSVEVLTNDFYGELSDWYAWAIQEIKFPNDIEDKTDDEKYNNECAIRLITRLMFVWFLKQRHLIPEEFFDEQFIATHLLKDFAPNKTEGFYKHKSLESRYYKAILQNLFFAVLNRPICEVGSNEPNGRRFRKADGDYNINYLMRYEEYFKDTQLFLDLANRTVPFLNGGLFDCLDDKDKGVYFDCFTDRKSVNQYLVFPDFLFFGEETGTYIDLSEFYGDKKKKKVSARGIIDILKRYNFTVEENTPFDKEVSLDPELLGKAFENLLAAYNPETQTTARKQTGSFYTPREIVQYMVDESLIAHLKRTVGDDLEAEYRKLLQYTDEPFNLNPEQCHAVMQSLYNCKILDPACGSGAFPMGVLQQMVHILQRIDPDNTHWKTMMLDCAVGETKEAFQKELPEERSDLLKDIERSFDESINRPDYARKLYLIENCIYGVDIQPIAIQISKLRFFISLVVDQKTNNNPADNFGIRPLPNLEAKFVAANTLIGLNKTDASLFDTEEVKRKEAEMKEARHKIFSAKTVKTKRKYRQRMVAVRQELSALLEQSGAVDDKGAAQLNAWDMFDQNASSPFFDPEWMFGVKDGFDIVIGNPPYGAKLSDIDKKTYRRLYPETQFKIDTYSLFVLKAMNLLFTKGISTYILPNTLLDNYYEEGVRRKLLEKYMLIEVNDLNDKVFEGAVVHAMILSFANYTCNDYYVRINTSESLYGITKRIPVSYFLNQSNAMISIRTFEQESLIKKLCLNCIPLEEVLDIRQAIKTGNDKKYLSKDKEAENFKPILRGKDIQKYALQNPNIYINYGKHLACPRHALIFEQPKLLIREAGTTITATYDDKNYYIMSSLYNAILINPIYDIKYILALINSHIYQFLMNKLTFEKTKGAFTKAKIFHYYKLPVKIQANQKAFVDIVDCILRTKQTNAFADTSAMEKEIDLLAYHLYELTYDEVLIVDPDTPITEEEYNNHKN